MGNSNQPEHGEPSAMEIEIRQLRRTIVALRNELETGQSASELAV